MGIPSLATFATKKKKSLERRQKRQFCVQEQLAHRRYNELKVMTEKQEPDVNRDYITNMNVSPHNRMRHLSVISTQRRQQQPIFVLPLHQNGRPVIE